MQSFVRACSWPLLLGWTATAVAAEPSAAVGESVPARFAVVVHLVAMERPEELDAKIAGWFLSQAGAYASVQQERFQASELFGAQAPGVHVFVTRLNADELRIFFVCRDGSKQRYLVRDLPLTQGLDEMALENTAQVVFSGSLAVWEGREETTADRVSAALAPLPDSAPTTMATPAATVPHAPSVVAHDEQDSSSRKDAPSPALEYLVASAGYSLRYRGPAGAAHGPLLGLGIAQRKQREIGVRLSGTLLLPITVEQEDLRLRLKGYSVALEPWLEFGRERPIRFLGSLALGMDIVNASASATHTGIEPTSPSWEINPFLAPRVGVDFALEPFHVGVALDLAVQFVQRHYDVAAADEQQALITAWRVQPGLLVQAFWGSR